MSASNLCTPPIALSTAVEQSHKDSVQKATVEEQFSSKTIHSAMRSQLHLQAFDLSWALVRYSLLCPFYMPGWLQN